MYQVIEWSTGKVLSEWEKITVARFQCRKLGHTGEDEAMMTGYPPVAFVSDGKGCVYNPRFKKDNDKIA